MPLISVKKFWTPLEIFGFKLYFSHDKEWYLKRRHKALTKLKHDKRKKLSS